MDPLKISVIRQFNSVEEAALYQALLESCGIKCMLLNEFSAEVMPIQNEMSIVKLAINKEDKAKAEEILSAKFDPKEFQKESEKEA